MAFDDLFHSPLTALSGIGVKTAAHYAKLDVHSIWDLLLHLPIRYEDRTQIQAIGALRPGMTALVIGEIDFIDVLPRGRRSLICRISDGTGFLDLRFFHFSARQAAMLHPGRKLSCYGEIRLGFNGLEMAHPDYSLVIGDGSATGTALTPVYPLGQGLSQHTARKIAAQAVAFLQNNAQRLPELLPKQMLDSLRYPELVPALMHLHRPEANKAQAPNPEQSRQRLALEELLAHHLSVKSAKLKAKNWRAPRFDPGHARVTEFIAALPFELTRAQRNVMAEISADCQSGQPMMRLLQGDVGSGKTVVAAYTALLAILSGYQVALMAPTELLAEQHYRNFRAWFVPFNLPVYFLTSQQKSKLRDEVLAALANPEASIVVGTHALFQDHVNFYKLGLVMIDEQHRFGVHQRLSLRAKGQQEGTRPHQLIMTATPIPRTLAMLQYSDLDISIIDELPPGRKPIITSVIPSERRDEVIQRIQAWVDQKKQVYWVCTLIEESELLQCEAAEITSARLAAALPGATVGLLHGRMKSAEKDQVMQAFKNGEINLLVATIVIEVGVDVPNASLMVIENPERLGLAQLHQLRGRVGRGPAESFCLLLYQSPLSANARQRLGILRDSQDGFLIADKDLQIRGPGEMLGTRQTGQVNFKVADLSKDADLLDNIASIAAALSNDAPEHIQPLIARWLGNYVDYSEV